MSDNFKKSFSSNNKGDNYKNRQDDGTVAKELKNLFKNDYNDYKIISQLRGKYNDKDLVDKIFDAYKERQKYIMKKALRFKKLLHTRYSAQTISYKDLIRKARKYAKKYKLSDDEVNLYIKLSLTDRAYKDQIFQIPNTTMRKTLGYATAMVSDKLNIKPSEAPALQEILNKFGETKRLHTQIIIQAMEYRDCAAEAVTGEFKPASHNVYSFIHPLITALFLPNIKLFKERMLMANIGYIVKCKHNGEPILTKPDHEFYWDLVHDENDNVCTTSSAMEDLKNRFSLQTQLWESVLNLRQGKYYQNKLNTFVSALDNCRNNIYDAPDLTYVKDEGAMLRRLLGAFSLRPTFVSTTRIFGIFAGVPGVRPGSGLTAQGLSRITRIPMITLRLPLNLNQYYNQTIQLEEALNQPQWYVENKMIVPKNQTIMYSHDVLFFYVGRRFQSINVARLNAPYNFTRLPMTISGWDRLNDRDVMVKPTIRILHDVFQLRSVIFVESTDDENKLITGSTAGIVVLNQGVTEKNLYYNPQYSGILHKKGDERTAPISALDDPEFNTKAQKSGTIFMYQKVGPQSQTPFGFF